MAEKQENEQKAVKTRAARETLKCSVEGCKRPYRAKGYCVTHYKKWRRGEMADHRARYNTCSKEGCRKPSERFGLCAEHGAAPKEEAKEAAAPETPAAPAAPAAG